MTMVGNPEWCAQSKARGIPCHVQKCWQNGVGISLVVVFRWNRSSRRFTLILLPLLEAGLRRPAAQPVAARIAQGPFAMESSNMSCNAGVRLFACAVVRPLSLLPCVVQDRARPKSGPRAAHGLFRN